MLQTLTRSELLDAFAFHEIDPAGERRADMRAMSAALIASGTGTAAPNMIYPYFGNSFDEEQQAEEFIDQLEAMHTQSIEPKNG